MTLIQNEPKKIYIRVDVQPITTAGIYHNSDLGLISLSSDGTTWTTIADKNLGATTVRNSGDTLSEANCGKYYQRGNNYGFPRTGSVSTSSSTVNTSTYGPGNYYSGSTFIIGNYNWSSVQNDNLWGATTGTNEAMQGPSPSGFHVPTHSERQTIYNILISTFGLVRNATTMGTYLKMPLAGSRDYSSAGVSSQGSNGGYWSSSGYATTYAYVLSFNSTALSPHSVSFRAYGFSVRAFKNDAVQPDTDRTVLYQ